MTRLGSDDTVKVLEEYMALLDEAIATRAEPLSVRARALSSVHRFAERAVRILRAQESGADSLPQVATALELRDLAREEQRWLDGLFREETFDDEVTAVLQVYKVHLAALESASSIAVGYIDTDREADPEHGGWWSHRAGQLVMKTAALGPHFMRLPQDRHERPE